MSTSARSRPARAATLIWALILAAAAIGCGDDGAVADDAGPCVGATGCNGVCEPGNAFGVGRYCTAGGGECFNTPNQMAPFCTADSSDTDLWFCTRPCANDDQCGEGAVCESEAGGGPMGCFPIFCYGDEPDAGAADAGAADASADASLTGAAG